MSTCTINYRQSLFNAGLNNTVSLLHWQILLTKHLMNIAQTHINVTYTLLLINLYSVFVVKMFKSTLFHSLWFQKHKEQYEVQWPYLAERRSLISDITAHFLNLKIKTMNKLAEGINNRIWPCSWFLHKNDKFWLE
jgi:hypothetical protein